MSDLAPDRRPLPLVLSLLTAVSLMLGLAPHQPVFAAPRHGAECTIQGTSGADRLVGTTQDDVICGEQGDDFIFGGGGNDTVVGGNGQDVLFGGPGADVLEGGNGKDLLIGGTGRDTVDGGNAKDECDGVSDGDVLSGCESAEPAGLSVEDGKPGAAADPDGDSLPLWVEERFGSHPLESDVDGDGLDDAEELASTTDPHQADSDGDGRRDGDSDTDGDGLSNRTELDLGSSPVSADADRDGLDDSQERQYGSSAATSDTDADGLTDGQEHQLGTSPTSPDTDGDGLSDADESYDKTVSTKDSAVSLSVVGPGATVLDTSLQEPGDERLRTVPGQVGSAVDAVVDPGITRGTLSFTFDPGAVAGGAELTILHWDAARAVFEIPADQTVDLRAGTATVTADDFSPFVLVDLEEFQKVWNSELSAPREGSEERTAVDAVLSLDSSGSMVWNDPSGIRKEAAVQLIDSLLDGDRVGVVDFDSFAYLRQQLTGDFAAAKRAVQRIDAFGGTDIGAGLRSALNELTRAGRADSQQVVVLLTDGEGAYDPGLTSRAASMGVRVYTVGLGDSVDDGLLGDIAAQTGGTYYKVNRAAELPGIFDSIEDEVNLKDSDGDGIADRHETEGFRDGVGTTYKTDPDNPDTDGDGLSDGEEAGELREDGTAGEKTYYPVPTDPTRADTDGDDLPDSDEAGIGPDPRNRDTDGDGLDDFTEVDAGYDPEAADGDGDGMNDAVEDAQGTDPEVYDLETSEKVAAFLGGLVFGDAGDSWAADAVGLTDELESSSWYLLGWIASGVLVVGDVRDVLYGLGTGQFGAAALSAVAFIPIGGDAAKSTDNILTQLGKHPDKAYGMLAALAKSGAFKDRQADFMKLVDEAVTVGLVKPLARDAQVAGRTATAPLSVDRRTVANYISRNKIQNAHFKKDLDQLIDTYGDDLNDIRMDQQQVLANGTQAGKNRPDLQYLIGNQRYYREYDTPSSNRALEHYLRIKVNDPNAIIELITVG
ncbi:VWA domain-containing protein [Kocuria turfanensis]|uniref:VWFA domain-containing protein n=2 Tax=Kocuria turfanensis TaxID=388357 RepID=A0A512ICV1_9MICC|nr:VWA domain-containing protein [Kocuria turfanensis]GEO95536.1 hypothetical protein KTU01_16590 [Kocuria turfanensis]